MSSQRWRPRIVVVGGGVAGLYFIYELTKLLGVRVVLVEPSDYHQFPIGIPIAMAGLVNFEDLYFPFSEMRGIIHVKAFATAVEGNCVRLAKSAAQQVCGDYLILAPGGVKLGSTEYWKVSGAAKLYQKLVGADGVRFIVNTETPVIGFQEIAYSIKSRFPDKTVGIHLIYVGRDYAELLAAWTKWAESVDIELSKDPPPLDGTLHVSVPTLAPHPLTAHMEIDPVTFEVERQRVYVIGDTSLIKLGLPPIGWGAIWQAYTLARAVAKEIAEGPFEVEASSWAEASTKSAFYKWLTYRMMTGTPLANLKGLYNHWRDIVNHLSDTASPPSS